MELGSPIAAVKRISLAALAGSLLFLPTGRAAEVVFEATVNRTNVPADGTIRLTIAASVPDSSKIEHLELPDTGSLEVAGTQRSQSTSISFTGQSHQFQTIQNTILTLRPTKEGVTTIGSAVLKYAGSLYRTQPIQIQITKARGGDPDDSGPTSPKPRRRGFPDDDWFRSPLDDMFARGREISERDLFVRVNMSDEAIVEGQQTTLTLTIYSRVNARIGELRWPKLDGFFSTNFDTSKTPVEEKIVFGERYQSKIIGRRALFPLAPGELEIDPIEVKVDVSSSPFFSADQRTLRTEPIRIKVAPLPSADMPDGFHRSNVGAFSLSASVDTREVALNQPVTFTQKLQGTGNIANVRLPDLPPLPGFKVFDPAVDVQVNPKVSPVQGTKTVEILLLPLSSGSHTIPALEFHYFDPERGRYESLSTEAIPIQVAAGPASEAGSERQINIVAGAFQPIRYASPLGDRGPPFYRDAAFVPLLVTPPALWLLTLFITLLQRLAHSESPRSRMRKSAAEARRELRNARKLAASGRPADFYAALKQSLLLAVEARTGLAPGGLTLTDLRRILEGAHVPADVIEDLVREIENSDFGRFAPAASQGGEMSESLERAGRLLRSIGRARSRPEIARRGGLR